MRKKFASLLVAGGLLATLSISGLFVVQQNQANPPASGSTTTVPTVTIPIPVTIPNLSAILKGIMSTVK